MATPRLRANRDRASYMGVGAISWEVCRPPPWSQRELSQLAAQHMRGAGLVRRRRRELVCSTQQGRGEVHGVRAERASVWTLFKHSASAGTRHGRAASRASSVVSHWTKQASAPPGEGLDGGEAHASRRARERHGVSGTRAVADAGPTRRGKRGMLCCGQRRT